MEKYIDISAVISWPQAVVAVALLVVIIALPQWYTYQQGKALKASLEATHTTLTQNNGGGSVKDALDAIREDLTDIKTTQHLDGERLTALENAPRKRRWR